MARSRRPGYAPRSRIRWTCADAWVAWSQGGGAFIYRILVIEIDGRLKTKRPLA
jgi:hypothetical protein